MIKIVPKSTARSRHFRAGQAISGTQQIKYLEDFLFSKKYLELVCKADELIENEWTKIKKSESKMDTPHYVKSLKDGTLVSLSPVYTTDKFLLLEIGRINSIVERIFINRNYKKQFRYEKTILTDHGFATLKSFDHNHKNNNEIKELVVKNVETYIPKFLPKI